MCWWPILTRGANAVMYYVYAWRSRSTSYKEEFVCWKKNRVFLHIQNDYLLNIHDIFSLKSQKSNDHLGPFISFPKNYFFPVLIMSLLPTATPTHLKPSIIYEVFTMFIILQKGVKSSSHTFIYCSCLWCLFLFFWYGHGITIHDISICQPQQAKLFRPHPDRLK